MGDGVYHWLVECERARGDGQILSTRGSRASNVPERLSCACVIVDIKPRPRRFLTHSLVNEASALAQTHAMRRPVVPPRRGRLRVCPRGELRTRCLRRSVNTRAAVESVKFVDERPRGACV
jgi:hypothetical protein